MNGFDIESLPGLLDLRAQTSPDATAYVFVPDGGEDEAKRVVWSYADLQRESRKYAGQFVTLAPPGGRVVLLFPFGLEFIAAFFGAMYAGLVPVPLYPPDPNRLDRGLEYAVRVARDCSADAIVLAPEFRAYQDHPVATTEIDVPWVELSVPNAEIWMVSPQMSGPDAFLQYTSGSTGHPKGVRLSHANVLNNQDCIAKAMRSDSSTVMVTWLPMYHDMGLVGCIIHPIYVGGSCWLLPTHRFIQQPLRWLSMISKVRGTISGAPNFAFDLCARRASAARADLNLSCWKVAFNGSEPVRADTLERFYQAFKQYGLRREALFPCYGMAEASLIISGAPSGPRVLKVDPLAMAENRAETCSDGTEVVSSGFPAGDTEIRVVGFDDAILADRQIGEIYIRGKSVSRGYWGSEASHLVRLGADEDDPALWLKTGDAGFLDQGEIFVTGRLRDLIIVRGRKYLPEDLEQTVRDHSELPSLLPGCAFAMPDETIAFVQETRLSDPEALQALANRIRKSISAVHGCVVEHVVLCRPKSIPKTLNGKIRRSSCRDMYVSGAISVLAELSGSQRLKEAAK